MSKYSFAKGFSLTVYKITNLAWLGAENFSQSVGIYMHTVVPYTFVLITARIVIIKALYTDGTISLYIHHNILIMAVRKERSIMLIHLVSLRINLWVYSFLL